MSSVGDVGEVIEVRSECGVDGVSGVKRPGIDAAPAEPPKFTIDVGEGVNRIK